MNITQTLFKPEHVVIWSQDFDGCVANRFYDKIMDGDNIIRLNKEIIEKFIDVQVQRGVNAIIFTSGSNRGNLVQEIGAMTTQKTGMSFVDIERLATYAEKYAKEKKYQITIKYDNFLIGDVYNNKIPGTTIETAIKADKTKKIFTKYNELFDAKYNADLFYNLKEFFGDADCEEQYNSLCEDAIVLKLIQKDDISEENLKKKFKELRDIQSKCYSEFEALTDEFNKLVSGSIETNFSNDDKELTETLALVVDDSKISTVYAQLNKYVLEYPKSKIDFVFDDDRTDILQELKDFYDTNRDAIPEGISLSLNVRDAKSEIRKEQTKIIGTGYTDPRYDETIQKILKGFNPNSKIVEDISKKHGNLEAFKKEMTKFVTIRNITSIDKAQKYFLESLGNISDDSKFRQEVLDFAPIYYLQIGDKSMHDENENNSREEPVFKF